MAKKTTNKGIASVVRNAPKSANGKSATTAKKAGAKARKKSHAQTIASVREASAKAGVKMPYFCKSLDEALAKADKLPTLTSAGLAKKGAPMGKTAHDGRVRREWCEKVGAPLVAVWDIVHENQTEGNEVGIVHDRPENTVRARVRKRGEYAHKNPDHYYAVRGEAYNGGEVPTVYIVRR